MILYGSVSDWCEEFGQQISHPHSTSTGIPVPEVKDESESRVAPNVVSILTNSLLINFPVQGDLLRRHNERFENLSEEIRANNAGEDAGLMRKISRDQYFVTVDDMDLNGL